MVKKFQKNKKILNGSNNFVGGLFNGSKVSADVASKKTKNVSKRVVQKLNKEVRLKDPLIKPGKRKHHAKKHSKNKSPKSKTGSSFFNIWRIRILTSLALLTVLYTLLVLPGYNLMQFFAIRFNTIVDLAGVKESKDANAVAWNGKSRLSVIVLGVDTSAQGRKEVDSVTIIEVSPDQSLAMPVEIPTSLYVNTEKFGSVQIKKLVAFGDLVAPNYGEMYATDEISKAVSYKFDRYFVYDTKLWKSVLESKGSISLRLANDIQLNNQKDRYKVAVFDQNRLYLSAGDVLQFMADTSGGEFDVAKRHGTFLEGMISSFDWTDIWRLAGYSDSLHTYAKSDFSIKEFIDFVGFTSKKSSEFTFVDPSKLPEKILGSGETVRMLQGDYLNQIFRQNPMNKSVQEELARVEVINGSNLRKVAYDYANVLRNQGVDVIRRNNAPRIYPETIIYVQDDSRSYKLTLDAIHRVLGGGKIVKGKAEFLSTADIVVVLGEDIKK